MILFADTSALIKLYIEETGSDAMWLRQHGQPIAASVLAYPEIHATLARRRRESLLGEDEHAELVEAFDHDWRTFLVVSLQVDVVGLVPRLVSDHPLRGADAVHLASALALRQAVELELAVADHRLAEAAAAEGLATFDPEEIE